MISREQVIKWLECCGNYDEHLNHVGCTEKCPYYANELCCDPVAPFQDALELLKEQEPIKLDKEHSRSGDTWWYVCRNCQAAINLNDKYCHECGRRVILE